MNERIDARIVPVEPETTASRLSPQTRRVYAGAWRAFVAWCEARGLPATKPVLPERLVAYVESLPQALGPNGVKLRLAAIASRDGVSGGASTSLHPAVRAALRRRRATDEAVCARLDSCGEDLAGLRNRALLLLVQAGGLAPAEVVGLDREDLSFESDALVVQVRPPNAPAETTGQSIRLLRRRGDPLCPSSALERWLQRSGIRYAAVFRSVTVHGTLERRLGVVGVRRILQQIEAQAAAQAMPEGRRLVRGSWRKPGKRKHIRVHGFGASPMGSPIRKPGRTR